MNNTITRSANRSNPALDGTWCLMDILQRAGNTNQLLYNALPFVITSSRLELSVTSHLWRHREVLCLGPALVPRCLSVPRRLSVRTELICFLRAPVAGASPEPHGGSTVGFQEKCSGFCFLKSTVPSALTPGVSCWVETCPGACACASHPVPVTCGPLWCARGAGAAGAPRGGRTEGWGTEGQRDEGTEG